MLVRTFQAAEMSEALRMVKAELGLDAMILSSKKERRKGLLGYFFKPYYEVTAALEQKPVPRPNPYREEPPPAPPARELSTREEFQNSMLGPLAREVRELKQRVEALTKRDAQLPAKAEAVEEQGPRTFAKEELDEIKKLLYSAVSGKENKQTPKPVTFPLAGALMPEAEKLRQELSRLQLAPLEETAVEEREPAPVALPIAEVKAAPQLKVAPAPAELSPLDQLACELREQELSAESLSLLLEQVQKAAPEQAGLPELRKLALEVLAGLVKCSGSLRMKKNGARILAIVGPTGVGKTTTIAKLAAMHALNRGASVALVTLDNFRVGAVEQLKTYAKIMDLPLEVAATAPELAKVLEAHAGKDLILIDTAGRSPKDAERIDELKGFLECYPGIETCLCMSATTRSRELDEIVATFGQLPVGRFLFTKLDECESYGCIVNTQVKHKLPISYFTTGQKVPEDIEVASSRKLASLVLKESTR